MSIQLKDYINSKRMCCIKGSFCPSPQPTVFCRIFLNSSDNIWTLSYKIPLVCPLTSPILLSTSLRRCLVPSDLVQLLAESVTTTAPPPAAFNSWWTAPPRTSRSSMVCQRQALKLITQHDSFSTTFEAARELLWKLSFHDMN